MKKRYKLLNTILIVITVLSVSGFIILWINGGYTGKIKDKIELNKINSQYQTDLSEYESNIQKRTGDIANNDNFKFICIGNSITKHEICDYWWGEWGMAASVRENDYVHQLEGLLKKECTNVQGDEYNFAIWETVPNDRFQVLKLLDTYLQPDLNLVVIQLGENANNITTLKEDYQDLIGYVEKSCPKAQIIVVGEFWNDCKKDQAKLSACKNKQVDFLSLDKIQNKEYQNQLGFEVLGDDSKEHIIEHDGVASHPNDKAMEYIAESIFERIN